jgi:N6-L-threonylcarbamoyladenine synthase
METKILSIDTSCDETSAAITLKTKIIASKVWSQASLHAKFGGVYPSLAKRKHEERIDFVINEVVKRAKTNFKDIDALAITIGPGLAPALEVGINKVKEIAKKYNKKVFAINHIEGHFLSPLINKDINKIKDYFPALGLIVSGGNTQLVFAQNIGDYEIIAETVDDALGEALDKGARALGLGYPGGPVLEKVAEKFTNNSKEKNPLPVPLAGQENLKKFSYSGLKTALVRTIKEIESKKGSLNKEDIIKLSYFYQESAFKHIERVLSFVLDSKIFHPKSFLVGGGVAANNVLRKKLRKIAKERNLPILFPPYKKFCSDNAAMIGVCAAIKIQENKIKPAKIENLERIPRFKISSK